MPTFNLFNPLQQSMDFTESYMKPVGGPMYHNLTGYDVAKKYYDEYGPGSMVLAPAGIVTGGIYDLLQGQNPFGQGLGRIKGMIDFYKTQLSGQPTPTSMAYSPFQADYLPYSGYLGQPRNEGILELLENTQPAEKRISDEEFKEKTGRTRKQQNEMLQKNIDRFGGSGNYKQINSEKFKGMGFTRGR